ncbi:hypothetical protein QJS04_geneDACA006059 [Acorus gramineus]|uniref:Zinc transporter 6, chloroplastic n=1 Tax=Acorus gramineus TaxID=55184 RepID=A0AAV9B6R4_ACOGR|nr:hypothetical protein QJS04_geneDACA006059 [Acorus gramineus]
MADACALDPTRTLACRNTPEATHLKFISTAIIFFTSVVGISSPVFLARLFRKSPAYAHTLLLIKCYAAGVILSTSLVHVLPDAFAALSDCRVASRHPWRDFPFSGFVSMAGALIALLVDVAATSSSSSHAQQHAQYAPIEEGKKGGCAREGGADEEVEELARMKQRLVAKVLEVGIVFHSVIIGVTMGMSQNLCTIRPLVAALSFHQIFEGMGLGGCIAQAGFNLGTTASMCAMFSVTTPMGIILGMLIFYLTGYDDSNVNALISEGLLGSLSSGILIYMALVDLIAADFFHNKAMSSKPWLKKASYTALVLGSASMSVLALWA